MSAVRTVSAPQPCAPGCSTSRARGSAPVPRAPTPPLLPAALSRRLLGLLRDAQNDCAALEDWRRSRAVAHLSALLLDVRGSTGARDAVAAEYVRKGEAKAKAFAGLPEFPTSTAPDAPPEAQPEVEMQLAAEPPPEAQPQLEAPKERRSSGRKVRGKRGA